VPAKKRLGELLVDAGLVRNEQLIVALQQQAVFGGQLGKTLVRMGAISEDALVRFLAAQLALHVADLAADIDASVIALVPKDMCERLAVFPIAAKRDGKVDLLALAMADPTNLEAVDAVAFKTGRRVVPLIASETAIESAIRAHHYGERRRHVEAQSPVQFAGADFDLDLDAAPPEPIVAWRAEPPRPVAPTMTPPPLFAPAPRSEPLPVVTGVLEGGAREPVIELDDVVEPEFSALQEPLSGIRPAFAPPLPPYAGGAVASPSPAPGQPDAGPPPESRAPLGLPYSGSVASEPPIVRSTGSSPETPMVKVPEQLAAAPFCPDCGATRVAGAKFCPHCGLSFTGMNRATGAPPAIAPETRRMPIEAMQAPPPPKANGVTLKPGEVDVDILEGLGAKGTVVQLRPRTASAANVDEPAVLSSKDAAIGLGVTTLVPSVVTDASNPDDAELIAGRARPKAPVSPMHLHVVTNAMARVDDTAALGGAGAPSGASLAGSGASKGVGTPPPPNGAGKLVFPPRAPAAASEGAPPSHLADRTVINFNSSATLGASAPTIVDVSPFFSRTGAMQVDAPKPITSIELLEGISRTSLLTSPAALVDDCAVLVKMEAFKIALGTTHMASVLADASLVDDPVVLGGATAPKLHITRATMHEDLGRSIWGGARCDDLKALAPKASLAKDWADAAERPIPRKDDRNSAPVPKAREVFFAPDASALPPPPPPPEPKVEYVPAPPASAGTPAPWATFSASPGSSPLPPPPAEVKQGPGLATMIMSLDDVQKQELADRIRQKAEDRTKEKK
jgi:type IV pilus assembly protein PilB